MSVTAKSLSHSGARGAGIDAAVHGILQAVDAAILRAPRTWGRNVVAHNVPVHFNIPGLSKVDAQRVIYAAVLRSLDLRGFETRLVLEPGRTVVFTTWTTELSPEEVAAMDALVAARRLPPGALASYVAGGGSSGGGGGSSSPGGGKAPAFTVSSRGGRVMLPRGGMVAPPAAEAAAARGRPGGEKIPERGQSGLTAAEAAILGREF